MLHRTCAALGCFALLMATFGRTLLGIAPADSALAAQVALFALLGAVYLRVDEG